MCLHMQFPKKMAAALLFLLLLLPILDLFSYYGIVLGFWSQNSQTLYDDEHHKKIRQKKIYMYLCSSTAMLYRISWQHHLDQKDFSNVYKLAHTYTYMYILHIYLGVQRLLAWQFHLAWILNFAPTWFWFREKNN